VSLVDCSKDLDLSCLDLCPALVNLAVIRADHCNLGSLPLEQLTHLDLSFSHVEDWTPFSQRNLQRLRVLNLQGCSTVDDEMLRHVACCRNLCELNVSDTLICQVMFFSRQRFLENLGMTFAKVTSVRELQRCVSVKPAREYTNLGKIF
jgi:hypothetical protein